VPMRNLLILGVAAALTAVRVDAREPPQALPATPPASSVHTPQLSPPAPTLPISQPATTNPPAIAENLRTFDTSTLDLTWSDNRWLLTAGSVVLKDFGRKESEGRLALRLARTLELNQYGTVGSPTPIMEYWLCDGEAPHGPVPGYVDITFDPVSLHVEESQSQWCVRDSRRVLFNFGSRADDARQALAVLKKHGFSQVIVVGQPTPSMFVFLANLYGPAGEAGSGRSVHKLVTHETPETAARKADELKRLKEQVPGLDAETVSQPALRALRTPDQPHQPFSSNVREYGGEGLRARNSPLASAGIDRGDCVPFDWRRVQVQLEGNQWKLAAGGLVLASFGPDQDAARQALDAIRYYRFTEQRLVGRPQRCFCYFLVNNLAPRGVPLGVPSEPFLPEALKVHEVEGRWALCMGEQPIIVLGSRQEEAADLLEVIHRQRFDHLCRIGRAEDGFTFLVRTR
jgi:hypothetical protein